LSELRVTCSETLEEKWKNGGVKRLSLLKQNSDEGPNFTANANHKTSDQLHNQSA